MDAVTRFWLIRHGEPVLEARGRCYGSLDLGLSERGRTQMKCVAQSLKDEAIAAVYSSPSLRAVESACALCPAGAQVISEFREIHFGDFEGLRYEEVEERYPEIYQQWMATPTEVTFPNGENFTTMRHRVLRGLDVLRQKHVGETVAIVAHGGVSRILLAWALEMPDRAVFRLEQDYAAMNLLVFVEGCPSVRLLNGRAVK